jgi:DNA-directed RNA polymerase specialized sigma24 family protein
MMTDRERSSYIAMIQACEAAIMRVRTAIRAGMQDTEAVGNDLTFIFDSVEARLIRYAKQVASYGPEAFEEALDALRDRLLDDIWSLSYQTMEIQFGAYLNTRPLRVLQQIARKYHRTSVSHSIERLDHPTGEDGQMLGDTIADPLAAAAIDQIADDDERQNTLARLQAAINTLPDDERLVVQQRSAGISNNDIAALLGVSIATASRMMNFDN